MPVHALLEGGGSESINATADTELKTEVDLLCLFLGFWMRSDEQAAHGDCISKLALSSMNSWHFLEQDYFNPVMINTFKENTYFFIKELNCLYWWKSGREMDFGLKPFFPLVFSSWGAGKCPWEKRFCFSSVLSIRLFFQATWALLVFHETVWVLFRNVLASPVCSDSFSTCVFLPGNSSSPAIQKYTCTADIKHQTCFNVFFCLMQSVC